MLRAIVFDFDGVIANSEPLHLRAFQEVLDDERVALTRGDYYARYLGYDDAGVFRALASDRDLGWTPGKIAALVARKAVHLEAIERDVSVLFPGAAAAIRRAADAVPIAIASGALAGEIRRVLERERLAGCFTAIVGAEDTPVSKPAPDPYRRALEWLEQAGCGPLPPRDCVAIEDSHWGIESARAAGLRTVAVTTTYASDDLGAADLVIPGVSELDLLALRRLCEG